MKQFTESRLRRAVPSQVCKSLLLTAVFLYILSGIFSPLRADSDYSFRNEDYEEINLPSKPVVRMQRPGVLLNAAPAHIPKIVVKARKEGLEKVRLLEFEFPEGRLDIAGTDRLMAVYLLDKDGLVIGYHAINNSEPSFRIRINSVINYVQVYVECYKHGLWFEEFYIKS